VPDVRATPDAGPKPTDAFDMSSHPPIDRENDLVLTTYNIHRAIGTDGRADPGRVARVLHEIDADVIALQEVGATDAADADALLDRLAAGRGYDVVRGYTLHDERGDYGNALLTRLPVTDVEPVDLTILDREPRGALVVTLAPPGGAPLCVVATHLGLRAGERRAQAARLEGLLARSRAPVTAVLGDLNEWRPRAPVTRRLARLLGRAPRRSTFPARRPVLALDRVFVRPREQLVDLRAHRSPLARLASDHLPLVARISLRTASPPA
jgi:endonuclease/exonuclease/phosphatase family metal-dependent hydrolase